MIHSSTSRLPGGKNKSKIKISRLTDPSIVYTYIISSSLPVVSQRIEPINQPSIRAVAAAVVPPRPLPVRSSLPPPVVPLLFDKNEQGAISSPSTAAPDPPSPSKLFSIYPSRAGRFPAGVSQSQPRGLAPEVFRAKKPKTKEKKTQLLFVPSSFVPKRGVVWRPNIRNPSVAILTQKKPFPHPSPPSSPELASM